MERISRSWSLVKASWGVLRADRVLLLYPIASSIVTLVALALLLVIWLGSGGFGRLEGEDWSVVDIVLLYIAYFVIGLAMVALIVLGGIVTYLLFSVVAALGILAAVVLVIAVVILALIGSALSGIFNIALYRYAVGGQSDEFFPPATLAGAFKAK